MQPVDVQQLARRAIGLAGIEDGIAGVSHHLAHKLSQFADRHIDWRSTYELD